MRALFLLGLLVAGAASLSGCIQQGPSTDSKAAPGELVLTATWSDAQHLMVTARNAGGTSLALAGMNMTLQAPNGTMMPIHWNGAAPMLSPGQSVDFELHSMMMSDGTMGMTMDHAMAGDHMPMPLGDYMLRMGSASVHSMLGT